VFTLKEWIQAVFHIFCSLLNHQLYDSFILTLYLFRSWHIYSKTGINFPESLDGRTIAHVTEGNDLHVTQKRSRVLVSKPIDINLASFTSYCSYSK